MDGVGFWFLFVFWRPFTCGARDFLHIGYVEVCCRDVDEYVALHRVYITLHMALLLL